MRRVVHISELAPKEIGFKQLIPWLAFFASIFLAVVILQSWHYLQKNRVTVERPFVEHTASMTIESAEEFDIEASTRVFKSLEVLYPVIKRHKLQDRWNNYNLVHTLDTLRHRIRLTHCEEGATLSLTMEEADLAVAALSSLADSYRRVSNKSNMPTEPANQQNLSAK